jgi:hypothetical protein
MEASDSVQVRTRRLARARAQTAEQHDHGRVVALLFLGGVLTTYVVIAYGLYTLIVAVV